MRGKKYIKRYDSIEACIINERHLISEREGVEKKRSNETVLRI